MKIGREFINTLFSKEAEYMDVRKKYVIRCPYCGEVCCTISELDLSKYKRAWQLAKEDSLSNEARREYAKLNDLGFRYINVTCPNGECGYDGAILESETWGIMQK